MAKFIRGVSWLLIVTWATLAAAEDWPTYLYNNARTGSTNETLQFPLVRSWQYTFPAPPELAWQGPRSKPIEGKEMRHRVSFDDAIQVVVVGKNVLFGSSVDHMVECRNLDTGKVIWKFYAGGPIRLAPTVWNQKVYIGSDDGNAYCLALADGKRNGLFGST